MEQGVSCPLLFHVHMAMGVGGSLIPILIGGPGAQHKFMQTPLILFLATTHFQGTLEDMGPPPFILIEGISLMFSKCTSVIAFISRSEGATKARSQSNWGLRLFMRLRGECLRPQPTLLSCIEIMGYWGRVSWGWRGNVAPPQTILPSTTWILRLGLRFGVTLL